MHIPTFLLIVSLPYAAIPSTAQQKIQDTHQPFPHSVSVHDKRSNNSNDNINKPFTTVNAEMFARVKLLAAYLFIASAAAAPSFTSVLTSAAEMDGDFAWRLKSGNYSLPNAHASSLSKRSTDCNLSLPKRSTDCKALSAREDGSDVKVKVCENSVLTFGHWCNLKKDEPYPISPPTFTNLWNDVVAASCNDAECGEHIGKAKRPQHMGGVQSTLEMWLEGTFWSEEVRDGLVDVLRQAFDRAVVRENSDNGSQVYE